MVTMVALLKNPSVRGGWLAATAWLARRLTWGLATLDAWLTTTAWLATTRLLNLILAWLLVFVDHTLNFGLQHRIFKQLLRCGSLGRLTGQHREIYVTKLARVRGRDPWSWTLHNLVEQRREVVGFERHFQCAELINNTS